MSATLSLVTHPDDPTLLEIMLDEGQGDRRVARAPLSNPRAWEWTTPPSWLARGTVEALLDLGLEAIRDVESHFDAAASVVMLAGQHLADLAVEGPRSTPRSVARDQAAALGLLGQRTGDFIQVA